MGRCIVPGCEEAAANTLGLRLRKPGVRRAVWAPDLGASFCKTHAEEGGDFVIEYRPPSIRGKVGIEVLSGGQLVAQRTVPIRKPAA
jgi:hypothetical protein